MANKKMRKMAILAKIESVYGTDSVPTGAANAMVVSEVEITPLSGDVKERNLVQPWFGQSGAIQATFYGQMKFKTELSGSGAAGTAPKWDPLIRGCGASVTVSAGVSVTYAPISDLLESLTLYGNIDGILHSFTGVRGNPKFVFDAKGIPMIEWDFMGLFTPLSDVALPAAAYAGWAKPLAVNKANTTCTLHGIAVAMQHLDLDFGNQVVKRDLVTVDTVEIVDRKSVGSIVFENTPIATKDWVTTAKTTTLGSLAMVHGITAGNIIELDANGTMEVNTPTYSNVDGVQMMNLKNRYVPSSNGNDEWSIVVR